MELHDFKDWNLDLPQDKPLIIAGPCSAESKEQMLQSALGAAQQGARFNACLLAAVLSPRRDGVRATQYTTIPIRA